MKKSNKKMGALKDMMGRAMAARAGRGAMAAPAAPMGMGMGMKKGGSAKKMASGGSFRKATDGIATKGKTKAKQVTMKNGGKC
jgi:hypothetical protein